MRRVDEKYSYPLPSDSAAYGSSSTPSGPAACASASLAERSVKAFLRLSTSILTTSAWASAMGSVQVPGTLSLAA